MIRTLVFAAVAFGAASNAWAAGVKSDCYTPGTSADMACPASQGYQGFCESFRAPNIFNPPKGCNSFYICSSNLSACSGTKHYNTQTQTSMMLNGKSADGSIYPTGDRRNVGAPNGMDPPQPGGYGMMGEGYPTQAAANQADAAALAQISGAGGNTGAEAAAGLAAYAASQGNAAGGLRMPSNTSGALNPNLSNGGDPSSSGLGSYTPADLSLAGGQRQQNGLRLGASGSPGGVDLRGNGGNRGDTTAQGNGSQGDGSQTVVRNTEVQDRDDIRDDIRRTRSDFEDKEAGPTKYGDSADCRVSAKLDGKMSCAGTRKLMKAHEISNMVGQIGGTIATQVQGAQAQTSALNAGTQSAAMRGAASTQKGAGNTQLLMGMMNTAMGAIVMKKGMEHDDHAVTIESDFADKQGAHLYTSRSKGDEYNSEWDHRRGSKDGGRLAAKAITGAGIEGVGNAKAAQNTQIYNATQRVAITKQKLASCAPQDLYCQKSYREELRTQQASLRRAVNEADGKVSAAGQALGDHAANEQRKVAEEAKNSAMFAMLQGAQQMAQGIINKKAADQLEQAANKMEATENNPGLVIQPPGQDAFPATDPRTPTVITGNGGGPGDQNPASQDQTAPDSGAAPLGAGLPGPTDGAPAGTAPTPGKYVAGGGGAGAGGGGGGGMSLGGGSTQAPSAEGGDKGPTAANPYVSGTTPVSGGGGGNFGGQGGSKEASLNPADMMAAALGLLKPQEKDPNTQAYGNGRAPASQGMGSAFGLPEEDIFKMVEGAIRDRVKAGSVGG